jgi:hypothetical protein
LIFWKILVVLTVPIADVVDGRGFQNRAAAKILTRKMGDIRQFAKVKCCPDSQCFSQLFIQFFFRQKLVDIFSRILQNKMFIYGDKFAHDIKLVFREKL